MLLKETIKKVVIEQSNYLISEKLIDRELLNSISKSSTKAKIISGIRRCGKSSLLNLILKKNDKFNYFNFEDIRIIDFKIEDFEKLIEVFNEINPECDNFYFDEIQNIAKWEIFIRNLVDKKKNIYITGSNASLLSFELGTKLTGRQIRYELFPFSYKEMLFYTNQNPSLKTFEQYFFDGGFPEFIYEKDILYLQELVKDILYRDIIVRHSIKNDIVIKNIFSFLISNIGKEFSYQKIKNIFGVGSVNTIISYINYLEDSYLLFTVSMFNYSIKKQIINSKKIYAIDSGLIKANSISFSSDLGRILENIVFIEFKRQNYEVFYYKNNVECDFVIRKNNKIELFQVCYDLNTDNIEREKNGLANAMIFFNIDYGVILTYQQEDNFKINNLTIDVIPVWKWLINNKL